MFHNEKWISLNHHGSFSSFKKEECLKQINQSLNDAHQQVKYVGINSVIFHGFGWSEILVSSEISGKNEN